MNDKEINKKEETLDMDIVEGIKPFAPEGLTGQGEMLASGMALQKTQASFTTAITVQQPRKLAVVSANILEESALAGEDFYYGWNVKTKQGKRWIDGPTISLANACARNYGNCAVDVELVADTPTHYVLKGHFIDLETGFNASRLFKQRKSQGIGMSDEDRQEDIVFQIGQSKCIRNAVINAMPRWLISKAVEKAKGAAKAGIKENIEEARAGAVQYFKNKGVSVELMEAAMERESDAWTPENIVELRGMRSALEEGRVTIRELFPEPTETSDKEAQDVGDEKEKEPETPGENDTKIPDAEEPEKPENKEAPATKEPETASETGAVETIGKVNGQELTTEILDEVYNTLHLARKQFVPLLRQHKQYVPFMKASQVSHLMTKWKKKTNEPWPVGDQVSTQDEDPLDELTEEEKYFSKMYDWKEAYRDKGIYAHYIETLKARGWEGSDGVPPENRQEAMDLIEETYNNLTKE